MLLIALIAFAACAFIIGITKVSAHGKAHRLKCVCKFKSVTPEEDLHFVQDLLNSDRKISIARLTKRMDGGLTQFELEYSTDAKTQKGVLSALNTRKGLRELRVLSGSERFANVIYISKDLGLSGGLRKEEHRTRERTRHLSKRTA